MNDQPLPAVPVPAPPVDPACEWCGARPAKPYEVEPPMFATRKGRTPDGVEVQGVRYMKRHAIMAYACKTHQETFDHRERETAERKRRDAEAKRANLPYGGPGR